jgi:hypothetical protein
MSRIRIWVVRALFLVGVILLGCGLWLIRNGRPPIVIDYESIELGVVAMGTDYPIFFLFHNTVSQPVRILGATAECLPSGCGSLRTGLPAVIAPGGTLQVQAAFEAKRPGPFAYKFRFYSDGTGQAKIPLTVHGYAGVPASPADLSARRDNQ